MHTRKRNKRNNKTRKITSKASLPKKGKTPIIISKSIKSLPRNKSIKKIDITFDQKNEKSYSPSINKKLEELISKSPDVTLYECPEGKIYIENKKEEEECAEWNSDEAKLAMLKNIRSKKIDISYIVGPKQVASNCWFNCFFMVFFISDKGRKFFRYLRESMVKGVLPSGKIIPPELHKAFFYLNRYIDGTLLSYKDEDFFASNMNTNVLIQKISKELLKKWSKIKLHNNKGNPLNYYKRIIDYLQESTISICELDEKLADKQSLGVFYKQHDKYPDIIISTLTENIANINKKIIISIGKKKYKLDSVVLRDNMGKHFSCFITMKNKPRCFDGMSYSAVKKCRWKKYINKNEDFVHKKNLFDFNFTKGMQILFYYRIK